MMTLSPFTLQVIKVIRSVPEGKVATYGQVAAIAGNRRAARQVARILHTLSKKEELPWHRIVNKQGRISLDEMSGYDRQKRLLVTEGVFFDSEDRIDLDSHLWQPEQLGCL